MLFNPTVPNPRNQIKFGSTKYGYIHLFFSKSEDVRVRAFTDILLNVNHEVEELVKRRVMFILPVTKLLSQVQGTHREISKLTEQFGTRIENIFQILEASLFREVQGIRGLESECGQIVDRLQTLSKTMKQLALRGNNMGRRVQRDMNLPSTPEALRVPDPLIPHTFRVAFLSTIKDIAEIAGQDIDVVEKSKMQHGKIKNILSRVDTLRGVP